MRACTRVLRQTRAQTDLDLCARHGSVAQPTQVLAVVLVALPGLQT